jgi:hypothetical protein
MSHASTRGEVKARRSKSTDEMWSRIDPHMHRRFEEAEERTGREI